jgi:hypothetical protein
MTRCLPFAAAVMILFAASSLAQQVPDDSPRIARITRLLESDDAAVRRAALESLDALRGGLGWVMMVDAATWRALDAQLLLLLEHDADAELACFAGLMMLTGTQDLPARRQYLAERLATWQLQRSGRAPADDAREAQENAYAATWAAVLAALTRLSPDGKPAAEQLRTALTEAREAERWRYALALTAIGDTAPLASCLTSENAPLRLCAAFALLGDAAPPLAAVRMGLSSQRAVLRQRAIQSVPRLAEVPPELTLELARILEDWEKPVHINARDALVALGPRAAPATPFLMSLLDDPNRGGLAVDVLGAIGPAARNAVPTLVANALANRWQLGAQTAGRALANIAATEALALLAPAFVADLENQRAGLWPSTDALRGLGAAAAPELALFVNALERPELATRQNALFVLAGLGPAVLPTLPLVLQQLDGDDSWCWSLVAECVRGIGPAAAPLAVPKFEQRYAAASHLRLQLIVQLHVLGAAAEPLLLRASADDDPMVRWKADEALLQLPELSAAGAGRLIELLAKTEPKNVQQWLAQPTPWRHLIGPLSQLPAIPTTLARRLPRTAGSPRCDGVRSDPQRLRACVMPSTRRPRRLHDAGGAAVARRTAARARRRGRAAFLARANRRRRRHRAGRDRAQFAGPAWRRAAVVRSGCRPVRLVGMRIAARARASGRLPATSQRPHVLQHTWQGNRSDTSTERIRVLACMHDHQLVKSQILLGDAHRLGDTWGIRVLELETQATIAAHYQKVDSAPAWVDQKKHSLRLAPRVRTTVSNAKPSNDAPSLGCRSRSRRVPNPSSTCNRPVSRK